ncbi:unnamed protein product [Staurois parvus]|uniref:Uncharacterized protein n=1 Tax=Staurois parvus TaxID=386267 RepID=A0ABN9HQX0_9NEOB|nr:unnamed protein product [Staurois parvus]
MSCQSAPVWYPHDAFLDRHLIVGSHKSGKRQYFLRCWCFFGCGLSVGEDTGAP